MAGCNDGKKPSIKFYPIALIRDGSINIICILVGVMMRVLFIIPLILLFILNTPSIVTNPTYTYQIKTHKVIKLPVIHKVKQISRGGSERKYIGVYEATAYNLTKNPTATGKRTRRGIVAVDPRVIPLGTRLYIEGYGLALAADTGADIKGLRLDVWLPGDKAWEWGRRQVKVYKVR